LFSKFRKISQKCKAKYSSIFFGRGAISVVVIWRGGEDVKEKDKEQKRKIESSKKDRECKE
jgi:hypothetical protein